MTLSGLLLAAAMAQAGGTDAGTMAPAVTGPVDFPPAVVRDVRDDLKAEATKALRAAWTWGAVAVGSGIYAGVVLAGRGGNEPALKYLSFVGVLAGLIGSGRAGWRAHKVGALRAGLDEGLNASAGDPAVRLSAELVQDTGAELHTRLAAMRNTSRSALRAGCVVPVVLGGIGFYGLAVSDTGNNSGGDVLAGVGMGGALVIGAPAMLSYFGLRERLKRTETLVARWDEALPGQETKR